MRVLLSTIGSRGDVQPLVALAIELRALGAEVRLCVPPDFREWIEGLGFAATPIGPELRKLTAAAPTPTGATISPERARQMIEATVATQFETIADAATDCDVIVGATALQVAAPSVAEKRGIPYVFVAYAPTVLPSRLHPPIALGMLGEQPVPGAGNAELWARDSERFTQRWGPPLNAHRASIGLDAVTDVRSYILTANPWLAADPALAPWPDSKHAVFQPGALLVADDRALPPELEAFLDRGDPPLYFGFGSIRAPRDFGRVMIEAARACGRRSIVSRGWADLAPVDAAPDCLTISEVSQQALFVRVAAVVHHGGAGTTTAAALAGASQVVIPQMYDQPWWAGRVEALGIGAAHAREAPTTDSLARAVEHALSPGVVARARSFATLVSRDGARVAAKRVLALA